MGPKRLKARRRLGVQEGKCGNWLKRVDHMVMRVYTVAKDKGIACIMYKSATEAVKGCPPARGHAKEDLPRHLRLHYVRGSTASTTQLSVCILYIATLLKDLESFAASVPDARNTSKNG